MNPKPTDFERQSPRDSHFSCGEYIYLCPSAHTGPILHTHTKIRHKRSRGGHREGRTRRPNQAESTPTGAQAPKHTQKHAASHRPPCGSSPRFCGFVNRTIGEAASLVRFASAPCCESRSRRSDQTQQASKSSSGAPKNELRYYLHSASSEA